MKKVAVIAALVLLAAGITAYAQTVSGDRQTGEQEAPFTLNKSVWCGGPRRGYDNGDSGGSYGGDSYDNGNSFGGGYSCH
jgi:hypothetical protein